MNEVLRQEKKYLITLPQVYTLGNKLSQVLAEDAHNKGDGYIIRSLYFDTLDNQDFQEKMEGVEIRRKIRLRSYGPDSSFAMLEMKQKQGENQKKRSLRLERAHGEELCRGNYSVLLKYPSSFAAECYGLMETRCYRPRSAVEYRRRAFIAKENRTRITLDHHIIATESNFDIFSPKLLQNPVMDPYLAILEVKYNGFLLSYIKDILAESNSSEMAISKYGMSRGISMHYTF